MTATHIKAVTSVSSLPPPRKPQSRLIRMGEVQQRTGIKATTIDELEERGDFPKRVRVSPRAVAWVESEIDEWIEARMAAR